MLLLGKDGQLGRHLESRLTRTSHVIALGKPDLDIREAAKVHAMIRELNPIMIVNAAAYNDVDGAESAPEAADRINCTAVAVLAEAAAAIGASIIHFSTDYVFDGRKGFPYVETDRPNPLNRYGTSKLNGERALCDSEAQHLIVRTSWLFSEYPGNFVTRVRDLLRQRDRLDVVDDQLGSPTYAGDLADIVVKIIAAAQTDRSVFGSGAGNIVHAANSGFASRFGLAEAVLAWLRQTNSQTRVTAVNPVSTEQMPRPARRPADSRLSPDALARRFGIVPRHWRDALHEALMRADPSIADG